MVYVVEPVVAIGVLMIVVEVVALMMMQLLLAIDSSRSISSPRGLSLWGANWVCERELGVGRAGSRPVGVGVGVGLEGFAPWPTIEGRLVFHVAVADRRRSAVGRANV